MKKNLELPYNIDICAFVSSQKENNNVLVIESFLSAIHSIIEKILLLLCKHSHSII